MLVWIVSSETGAEQQIVQRIVENPLYAKLEVAREGRDIFLGDTLYAALSSSSPLSLPFLLDELTPRLAAAVDGDPATEPTAASP